MKYNYFVTYSRHYLNDTINESIFVTLDNPLTTVTGHEELRKLLVNHVNKYNNCFQAVIFYSPMD